MLFLTDVLTQLRPKADHRLRMRLSTLLELSGMELHEVTPPSTATWQTDGNDR